MKKTSSTPNLPMSSRMQMAAGGDKMAPMAKKAGKAGATTKMTKASNQELLMQTKVQGRPPIPKDSQRRHRVGVRLRWLLVTMVVLAM